MLVPKDNADPLERCGRSKSVGPASARLEARIHMVTAPPEAPVTASENGESRARRPGFHITALIRKDQVQPLVLPAIGVTAPVLSVV